MPAASYQGALVKTQYFLASRLRPRPEAPSATWTPAWKATPSSLDSLVRVAPSAATAEVPAYAFLKDRDLAEASLEGGMSGELKALYTVGMPYSKEQIAKTDEDPKARPATLTGVNSARHAVLAYGQISAGDW